MGENSIFNGDGIKKSLFDNVVNRVGFGGQVINKNRFLFCKFTRDPGY